MRLSKWLVVLSVLALALAACGGDSGGEDTATTGGVADDGGADTTQAPVAADTTTPEPAAADTTAAEGDGGGGDTPEVTEMGSFTVDGTEFAVTFLNRCIPFDGPESQDIDLQPIAQGQGAQLNLYGNTDFLEVSVQGSGVEEIGGTNSFGADSFGDGEIRANNIEGDRWTGDATLADSYGSDSTVDVTWDVMIPEEIVDCSL